MSTAEEELAPLLGMLDGEARAEAERAIAAAREEVDRRRRDAEARAETERAEAERAGRAEGEREARRLSSLAALEARRAALRARDAGARAALEAAAERLAARWDGPAGEALAAQLLRAAARALGREATRLRVGLRPEDRARLAPALRRAAPPGCAIELEEVPHAPRGLVVRDAEGRREVDQSLPALFRRHGDALRAAAAGALFAEPEGAAPGARAPRSAP